MGSFSLGMWDVVPRPRFKLRPPVLGMQSLSHWTAREVSHLTEFRDLDYLNHVNSR